MEDLVLAMPCREFIAVRGFSPKIDMAVLDSLQEDTWFTVPSAIQADPTAVVVHLALLIVRDDVVLVGQDGHVLFPEMVPPEAYSVKTGLGALKMFAEQRAHERLGGVRSRVELAGLVHEPKLLPRQVLLVYRALVAPGAATTVSGVGAVGDLGIWRSATEIAQGNFDWLDQAVVVAIPKRHAT
jgi:hypothetical protein